MKTIWKYPLKITYEQRIQMPVTAQVLCVQMQQCTPCIWAQHDDTAMVFDKPLMEMRTFYIVGTGREIEAKNFSYIGTFQTDGGQFVWHLFQ